jgi:hypothetical protein
VTARTSYEHTIARLRAEAAELDAYEQDERSRAMRPQLPPRPLAIGDGDPDTLEPIEDDLGEFDAQVEREHARWPHDAGTRSDAIRTVNQRLRRARA